MSARRLASAIVLVAALGVLVVCCSPALALRGVSGESSFGAAGSGDGEFSEPTGVAVNNSTGTVYVTDKGNDRVEYFSATGTYEGQFAGDATPAGSFSSPEGIAVDNSGQAPGDPSAGDVYVVDTGHDVVDKFSPAGAYISQMSFTVGIEGVAVDSLGNVWVEEIQGAIEFNSAEVNGEIGSAPAPYQTVPGIAVDGKDQLYAPMYYGAVWRFNYNGTAYAVVDYTPPTPTGVAVNSLTNDVYVDHGSLVREYGAYGEPFEQPKYEFGSTALKDDGGEGIAVNSSESGAFSEYKYVADSTADAVRVFAPEEPSPPAISIGTASGVTEQTARIEATVDPHDEDTSFYVEYGTESCASSPSSCQQAPAPPGKEILGSGWEPERVKATLENLRPGTEYHYRIAATNAEGTAFGPEATLATYAASSGLPDGRVYEMVSPAFDPYDSEVYEVTSGFLSTGLVPFEASVDGDAVVYAGLPAAAGNGASGIQAGDEYRATRSPSGGWTQVNVTPPGSGLEGGAYAGFSSDLSVGVVPEASVPPLQAVTTFSSEEEGRETKAETVEAIYTHNFDETLFRPLFDLTPPDRKIEKTAYNMLDNSFESVYDGASSDFSHLLFEANDDLIEGSGELEQELASVSKKDAEETKEAIQLAFKSNHSEEEIEKLLAKSDEFELYADGDGRLSVVNVLPEGKLAANATFGSPPSGRFFHRRSTGSPGLSNVISADGSRIFWTAVTTIHSGEYFDVPGRVYVRIGGVRTVPVSPGSAVYQTASSDGHYAYYTEGGDLWRFDVDSETREAVTSGKKGMQGVIGTNQTGEPGAYVYFVSLGALTSEKNAEGQEPAEGERNLYVSEPDPAHPGGHVTRFIATLSFEDEADWARSLGARTGEVAPDGRSVVFTSTSNLLGHPYPGEGSEEVYDYRVGDGRLFCVSCRPQASGGMLEPSTKQFMRRWVSADGDRVFFESEAPLVLRDNNAKRDVYEWEPTGAGTCTEAEGCVYLLSGGIEASAFFADASASGNDVFIATRQRLLAEDQNEMVDLYDARVDGVRPVNPPQCVGTGCQGAPAAAPIFATPSSVTFAGVGNFVPGKPVVSSKTKKKLTRTQLLSKGLATCRKQHSRSKRKACEAHERKLYGSKSHTTSKRGR